MSSPANVAKRETGYREATKNLGHRFRPTGTIDVVGDEHVSFLQGQLTQDMRSLAIGESRAAAGLTPKGKLLFAGFVLRLDDRIRLVVPESLRPIVFDHLRKYAVFTKVAIEDRSGDFARIGLYGPEGAQISLPDGFDRLAGENDFSASFLFPSGRRNEVEGLLNAAGSKEVSEAAGEILRVEAGRPRFGVDMDSSNLPDEVGLSDAISTSKGCYVGQEVVARLRTYGRVNRRLVGFRFPEGAVAAGTTLRRTEEAEEADASRTEAGRVTSSVDSPVFGPIGLGFAFRDVEVGATLFPVYTGGCLVPPPPPEERAIVTALPFE